VALEPEPGLVIRYDFLWKQERDAGLEYGRKDRPCAVVLVSKPRGNGNRLVAVCPITHTPPADAHQAVVIPLKVAQHLGLDDNRSWIRTNTVNTFTWETGRIPFGITPAKPINGFSECCRERSVRKCSISYALTAVRKS
jgi:hypothetical protein